jgi:hypothetical protein
VVIAMCETAAHFNAGTTDAIAKMHKKIGGALCRYKPKGNKQNTRGIPSKGIGLL